ncbi:FHA domain-containing protein [Ottowia testudinis]|uniref:FHA domain-containing protein n=1 Tax=Ottowia testudinis TaxID=2816950 RepID=A0A975CFP2_9BURK|nr:FHA domain-containing protein [Ottowia testudinis]QTD45578.1 FHA domain-containing protein [Ottowia testudinis]
MPKLIVSIDGVVVKEFQLTKDRSTIGRRPYNDVVIDNLAVSGEHAVIQMAGGQATLEDLGSTNGTYINGKAVKKQVLVGDDTIEVGKYKLKFLDGETLSAPVSLTGAGLSVPMGVDELAVGSHVGPRVRVLNGNAAGREMDLTKIVTTVGKPGLCVAAITRKAQGFDLAHVEGQHVAAVNGVTVDAGPITLKNRDQIDLGGIRLEFVDR